MKGTSDIVQSIQYLKMAKDHFESFIREYPGSAGARLFKGYVARIEYIHRDLFTHPFLPDVVRTGIKQEVESDCFSIPAITGKISLIPPDQREVIESIIDDVLAGETITAVKQEVV